MKVLEGVFTGAGRKVAIVASRFNELVVSKLVEGARDALVRHGMSDDALTLAWVPGAFEIPLVAGKLAASKKYDAVICSGRRHPRRDNPRPAHQSRGKSGVGSVGDSTRGAGLVRVADLRYARTGNPSGWRQRRE